MKHVKELSGLLGKYFSSSSYRVECLAKILFAMLSLRDVNLSKLSTGMLGRAKIESHYKRLQRFFKRFEFSFESLLGFVCELFGLPEDLILTLDRTNWQFGKKNINFLTLGIAYKRVALPILWTLLDKKGNSAESERTSLIQRLLSFGVLKAKRLTLLMDREFIGKGWLAFLIKKKMHFVARCRENVCASNAKGVPLPLSLLLRGLKVGKTVLLPKKRQVMGSSLYVIALRMTSGKLLILLTPDRPEEALELYAHRWNIEMLFSCLKERGFRFENTHMTDQAKLSRLMFALTLAFCIALKQGDFVCKDSPPLLKKHGYLAKSLFLKGLESIARLILNLHAQWPLLKSTLRRIFSPPKIPLSPLNYLKLSKGVL